VKKSSILAIAVTLLLLSGGLYYFLREEPPMTPNPPRKITSDPEAEVSFSGTSIAEEQNGTKLWELGADRITVNQTTKIARFYGLKGSFYQENGSKVDVTAREATLDPATKNISLNGDVRAVSTEGAVFTAAQARWEGTQKRFFGTGGITFTREDVVITGAAIESDAGLEKVKVQGQARALKGGLIP